MYLTELTKFANLLEYHPGNVHETSIQHTFLPRLMIPSDVGNCEQWGRAPAMLHEKVEEEELKLGVQKFQKSALKN